MKAGLARWAPLALSIPVAGVCFSLGFWQLDRLEQRRARNAEIEAGLKIVSVSGSFDFSHQQIVLLRPRTGVPGVVIATPLWRQDSPVLLVERGWVPSPDGKTVDLAALSEPAVASVEGYFMKGDTTASPVDAWPVFVRSASPAMVPQPNADPRVFRRTVLPEGAPRRMEPMALPELTRGPHVSYAVQWFAFGLIAVVGSIVLAVRKSA